MAPKILPLGFISIQDITRSTESLDGGFLCELLHYVLKSAQGANDNKVLTQLHFGPNQPCRQADTNTIYLEHDHPHNLRLFEKAQNQLKSCSKILPPHNYVLQNLLRLYLFAQQPSARPGKQESTSLSAVMISKPENYLLLLAAAVSFLALTSQSLVLIPRDGCIPYTRDIDNALHDFRISTSSAAASLDPEYGRVMDWFGLLEPLFPSLSFLSMILRPEDFDTLGLLTSSYFSLVVMFAASFLFVFYLVQVAA